MDLFIKKRIMFIFTIAILFMSNQKITPQILHQVWADEFNDQTIDRSIWNFEYGTANDNVHYFTDRLENAKIVDGKLQVIAEKESYNGFNYTAALLKTHNSIFWKYGRIEARIKLPSSNGFVPAFWMLPQDHKYGYWPNSGEIDILEHPTNQVDKIYGTVHTGAFNSFTGSGPRGEVITIADAESEFHLYAIEWTPEKIDFFVDDRKYFTFNNENSGFEAWPFDQPFYIILSMGVGGGWVGDPDASSIFPSIMEVDYVRVYQNLNDVLIFGPDYLPRYTKSSSYSLPIIENATYSWNVSGDAEIVSGQNTNNILVDWNTLSGDVEAVLNSNNTNYIFKHSVLAANNYLKNYGFEQGVNHWYKTRPYPGDIEFVLDTTESNTGKNCIYVEVNTSSANAWDVQLSQRDLLLESGKQYSASFWAKAKISGTKVSAAIINSTTFAPFDFKEFALTESWTKCELSFTPSSTVVGQFNIDMGGHLGSYYFDDFVLSTPELIDESNQITNADFSNGDTGWNFNSFSPAQATGEVKDGEFAISISNGGAYLWDIHLGQTNLSVENGKEYTVSFDAYAAEPRDISALVGKNSDPWSVYSGNQIISLTTERETYTYTFVMNDPTDTQARLGFDLGTSSIDLYFDNITLSKGEIPTGIELDNPTIENSFKLYQNYPNPFNPTTTIKYSIPPGTVISNEVRNLKDFSSQAPRNDNVMVTLKIYNILGKEIATLVNKNQTHGNYSFQFDASELSSGVYYYQLKTGDYFQAKKMLLLK